MSGKIYASEAKWKEWKHDSEGTYSCFMFVMRKSSLSMLWGISYKLNIGKKPNFVLTQ